MYSNGPASNGLVPTGSSGGGFLGGIPWWVYLIVILIGVGLSLFLFLQAGSAKRRAMLPPMPGSPPPLAGAAPASNGSGFMIGGIASALLLVVAPLVVMLIMQPWHNDNWLVGRWAKNPACTGQTVEFTSDGFVIARGDRKPYRLEGDRITVEGGTETIQHNGDQFTVDGQTYTRCSGSAAETATGASPPFGTPPAPPAPSPSPYGSPSAPPPPSMSTSTPTPAYASWLIGRWSDSNCQRAMEFRADGTATTANGQPATYVVAPNGQGVHITITSGGRQLAGWMDQTPSGAILRAYRPSTQTVNLTRC